MAPMLSTFGGGSIRGFNGGGSAADGGLSDLYGIFKDNVQSFGEVIMRFYFNQSYTINPSDINGSNWLSLDGNRNCFVSYISTVSSDTITGLQTTDPTNQTLNYHNSYGAAGYSPQDSVERETTAYDGKGMWFSSNDTGWLEVKKAASDLIGQKGFFAHGYGEPTGSGGPYHMAAIFKMYSSALSQDVYFAPKGSIRNDNISVRWGGFAYYPTVYSSFSDVASAAINNGSPYVLGASDFMY